MKFSRMKDLREDLNLSQTDIAKILFTTQTQYSRWERGANEPPATILIKLADFYNVSLDYLAGRTNEKSIRKHTTGSIRKTSPLPPKK